MKTWEPIQKSVDYIEQHIFEKFEIAELAGMVYLSVFYYQRLFKRLVGKPVMEYIKLRKLARSADCILKSKSSLSEISYKFGFENQETYTRAFKEEYGIVPSAYRVKKPAIIHFPVPDLSVTWRMTNLNIPLLEDGVVFEIEWQVLSQPRYFDLSESQNPVMFIADAEMEAPYITGFSYEPEGFIGWRLSIGSYAVCRIEVETEEHIPILCNKVIRFVFDKWARENRVSLSHDVGRIYHRYNPNYLIIELYFKIFTFESKEQTINKGRSQVMFEEKMSIEMITIKQDINVTGINFEKAGMEAIPENFGKMWDNFSDECKNSIPNIKRPIVQYGIGYPENEYLVGREVTAIDDANGRYAHYTLPAGKYLKVSFNAESFDQLVCEKIFAGIELIRYWINKNNLHTGSFHVEVYPSELTKKQYPEMYLLEPVNE